MQASDASLSTPLIAAVLRVILGYRFKCLLLDDAHLLLLLHILVEPRGESGVSGHDFTLQQVLQRANLPVVNDIDDAER